MSPSHTWKAPAHLSSSRRTGPKTATPGPVLNPEFYSYQALLTRCAVPSRLQSYCNRILRLARLGRKEAVLRMFLALFDDKGILVCGREVRAQTLVDLFDLLFIQMCCGADSEEERKKWRSMVENCFVKAYPVGRVPPNSKMTKDPTATKTQNKM